LGKQLGLSPPIDSNQTELGETSLQVLYLYLKNNDLPSKNWTQKGGFKATI
jgi:hypothetical protein